MILANSSNDSTNIVAFQTELKEVQAYIAIEVAIALLALFNNTLVLVAIYKYKYLHTSTYWLIGSLAWADIGVATLAIPSGIILRLDLIISGSSNQSVQTYPSVTEGLCLVSVSFALIFTQVSIFCLLIIAFDHFIAICYSLRYKAIVTSARVKSFIAGAWVLGALIGLIPQVKYLLDQSNEVVGNENEQRHCAFEKIINMEYMVYFNSFACTFLPLAIMFILYCCIFKSANEQLRKIYCGPLCRRRKSESSIKETVMTKQCCVGKYWNTSFRKRLFMIGNKIKLSRSDDVTNQCECSVSDVTHYEIDAEMRQSMSMIEVVTPINEESLENSFIPHSLPHNSPPSEVSDLLIVSSIETNNGYSMKSKRAKKDKLSDRKQSNWSNSTCNSFSTTEAELKALRLKRRSKFIKKEIHAARSLATVVGVFAVCWLPLHIHNVMVYFNPSIGYIQPVWLVDFAILLSHANSFINPIIYAFHLREMKKAFRKMIKPTSAKLAKCI